MDKETAKELALVTAIIIREDRLGGSLYQTFDRAYSLAKAFVEKYPVDMEWGVELEYEETIIGFLNNTL